MLNSCQEGLRIRKTLSSWLNNRYLLIIRNEENFAEKTSYNFTYAKVLLISVAISVVIFILSIFLVESLLAQWFDPRHAQMEARRQLVELYTKVDSLEQSVLAKQLFIDRIQGVLSGDSSRDFSGFETAPVSSNNIDGNIDPTDVAQIDSSFKRQFENMVITPGNSENTELPFLFTPLEGYISQIYSIKEDHLGVDIVSKPNEPVKCVADGTVIFSDWTREFGYVMAVQHSGNLISIYKHNAKLLKTTGNFVGEGEIISIIGNSGELTDGPHLHFELWYNGSPLNPEEFVIF